ALQRLRAGDDQSGYVEVEQARQDRRQQAHHGADPAAMSPSAEPDWPAYCFFSGELETRGDARSRTFAAAGKRTDTTGGGMARKFRAGDKVEWETSQGKTHGKVI